MENNNKDLFSMFDEIAEKTTKTIMDSTTTLRNVVTDEKRKLDVRSEIGHNKRELVKLYEQLGRQYYAHKVTDVGIENEADLFDRIRSKEKLIELLEEKLETL